MRADARIAFLLLLTVWAGIVIGVSLLATPVKFQAPSLTLQAGLEVGRYTFRLLARVELCLLLAVVAAAAFAQPRTVTLVLFAFVVVAVALQRFWLLPFLDSRVSEILAGGSPSFSIQHRIYAVMEAAKAALLLLSAALEYRFALR